MANVAKGKKFLAVCLAACFAVALAAVPSYALYYVHDEDNTNGASGQGAVEICLTVNLKAVGGDNTTDVMFIPNGGTVADVLKEGILSSESHNGLKAIHNYDVQHLDEYLAKHKYTVAVYDAASQNPGTQTVYDNDPVSTSEDYALNRYDSVVVTVTK